MMGGRGVQGVFLGQKFWPRDFFGSMKDVGIFLGCKKHRDFSWVLHFTSAKINSNIQ